MKVKKSSKARRKERRLAEIARAQAATQRSVAAKSVLLEKEDKLQVKQNKLGYHELPMSEIKKDMIKNAFYLVFAVAVIIGIQVSGIGYFEIPF